MARVTIEDCLRNASNRFILLHMAVKRTIQLMKGAPKLIDNPKNEHPTVTALREIAAGKVKLSKDVESLLKEEKITNY